MKRRDAIKGLILFSLGTGVIYSCSNPYQAVRDLHLDHLDPTDEELSTIDAISKIAVPIDKIDALQSHTALPFILLMVDDLFAPEDRESFIRGYQTFEASIVDVKGTPFSKMQAIEQESVISMLNSDDAIFPEFARKFYSDIKALSIQYVRSTEHYQRKINYYEMAPGRFGGSVPIEALQNRNTI